jgi:hypothetical protein
VIRITKITPVIYWGLSFDRMYPNRNKEKRIDYNR